MQSRKAPYWVNIGIRKVFFYSLLDATVYYQVYGKAGDTLFKRVEETDIGELILQHESDPKGSAQ